MKNTPPPAPEPASPLLTVAEVATQLRVDVQSVRRWIRDEQLAAFKVGREYRVHPTHIDRFLGRRSTTADA